MMANYRAVHRPLLIRWLVLFFLAGLGLGGCFSFVEDVTPPPGWQPTPVPPTPVWEEFVPDYPLDPKAGEALFAQHCASCHGPKGLGNGALANQLTIPPSAIASPEVQWQAKPLTWFQVLTEGRLERQMPPFQQVLSERDRWNVLAYVFTQVLSEEERTRAAQLYKANCAACHGLQGRGDGPNAPADMPDLTAPLTWTRVSPSEWADVIRQGRGTMPAFQNVLSEEDIRLLAFYLRELAWSAPASTSTATPAATATTAAALTGTGTPPVAVSATPPTLEATPTVPPSPVKTPIATPSPSAATPGAFLVTIRGTVTHAEGKPLPAGLPVQLQAFDQATGNLLFTRETTTDEQGRFAFSEVEAEFHRMFLVSVRYKDVSYLSESLVAMEGQTAYDVSITVYDTTTDLKDVVVQRLHLFLDFPTPDRVLVAELYVVQNNGNRTVVAKDPENGVLSFVLPEGATDLNFPSSFGLLGARFRRTDMGFVDTEPIRPGQQAILFSYALPYEREQVVIAHAVPLPVQAITVLVPEGVTVEGEGWTNQGTRVVQTEAGPMTMRVFQGPAFQAGEAFRVTVKGLPTTLSAPSSTPPRWTLPWWVWLLVGGGMVLMATGLWLWWRRQEKAPWVLGERAKGPVPPSLAEDPEALMDAILALDDLYAAGELEERVYRARRAAYKDRLAELLAKGRGPSFV